MDVIPPLSPAATTRSSLSAQVGAETLCIPFHVGAGDGVVLLRTSRAPFIWNRFGLQSIDRLRPAALVEAC